MYHVGDSIVYPMHGAGVIVAIEEKEIAGESQQYYIIEMLDNMKLMIPIKKMGSSGARAVGDSAAVESILDCFQFEENDASLSWRARYNRNLEKLKVGELLGEAEVVRDLMRMNRKKPLNSSERQMLHDARRILLGELAIITGLSAKQTERMLEDRLDTNYSK